MAEPVEAEGANVGVLALDVPLEEYLQYYAERFCEWVEGVVIRVTPSDLTHNHLVHYALTLLNVYFQQHPIGTVIHHPFILYLPEFPRRRRIPDLFVRLHTNPNALRDWYMDGAPDICIEVVHETSVQWDYADKLYEYEKGGVREYWIIDPLRKECRFFRLTDEKQFIRVQPDEDRNYRTPLLPRFRLHIPALWQKLPSLFDVVEAVSTMLREENPE